MNLLGILAISALCSVSIVTAGTMLFNELRGHEVLPDGPDTGQASGRAAFPGSNPGKSTGSWGKGGERWGRVVGGLAVRTWARIAAAIAVAGLVLWVTRWPVAAAACAGMVLAWPRFTAGRREEREEIAVLEAVLVWTQNLRDTVAGGASLEQAIGVSIEKTPAALRPGLEQVRGRLLVRQPLDVALTPLRDVPGADFVTAALMLAARRRGDRLPDVLSGIVATCAQEVAQRRQVLASRAGIHRSVQIIIMVTLGILAWMATIGAAYMAPYDSVQGQGVLAVVIAVIAGGFVWLARLDTTVSGLCFFTPALSASEDRLIASLAHWPATDDSPHAPTPGTPPVTGTTTAGGAARTPGAGTAGQTHPPVSGGRRPDGQQPWR
ncbi:hypothetical protein Kisp01_69620 [Kineosporia sp. NBRC 101677]|uniref:type II secretion system F family protein n=1 Tax=Kineosporia sp. NBRC 101677 TaxID=3032197 RepID=UPI00249FA2FC|nr:type II secretion system F family protein [Kineosporia sp. NBRC 101677]GLY19948.1 hypothetical protein Kisp01_69620 [Kineosporia sp. NBRC 101677]